MPRKTTATTADWSQALTRFAAHLVEHEKSEHTQKNYREDLLAFTDWYQKTFDQRPDLRALTPSELVAWEAHLRDTLRFGAATINRKLAALRSFLNWAAAEGLTPEIAAPRSSKRFQPLPRWLDRREQRALIRAVKGNGLARDIGLVALLLHTGLRVDELAALRWTDLEIGNRSGTITVRKGRGRKPRTIPLNAEVRNALIELRELRGKGRAPEVLQGQRGPLTGRGIQATLAKYSEAAGLEDLSPQVLRHTWCKNLADAGVRLEVIAALAGHESLETTRRYLESRPRPPAGGRDWHRFSQETPWAVHLSRPHRGRGA
ncbi:MAG: tyrosine-type recombinase/integrase [Isosphaeraceae bacterium]